MATHSFAVFETGINPSFGSSQWTPTTSTNWATATVDDTNDSMFHDNSGGHYTDSVVLVEDDPEGDADQSLATDIQGAGAGEAIYNTSHYIVSGSDGSTFLAFWMTTENATTAPLELTEHWYAFTEAPQPGVTYTFIIPESATAAQLAATGSGGRLQNAGIEYSELATTLGGLPDGTVQGNDNGEIMLDGYDDTLNGATGDIIGNGDGDDNDIVEAMGGNDRVHGGLGNDIIYGGDGADSLHGQDGDDSIYGGAGGDTVWGGGGISGTMGTGDDYYEMGSGDDRVLDHFGNDTYFGGAGNDRLDGGYSTSGTDLYYGGTGNDYASSGAGADTLYGGTGTLGSGEDSLYAGSGDDLIYAGSGNDNLIGDNLNGTKTTGQDTIYAGAGRDTIAGRYGDDLMYGGSGEDSIHAYSGDDTMFGGAGDDSLFGYTGSAYGEGGSGDDNMRGSSGNDTYFGGQGDDFIDHPSWGGLGDDLHYGGSGEDTINLSQGDDTAFGGTGSDSVRVNYAAKNHADGGELADDGSNSDVDILNVTGATGDATVMYSGGDNEDGTVEFANGDTMSFENFENVVAEKSVTISGPDGTVHGSGKAQVMTDGYDDAVNGANGDIIGDADENDNDIILGLGGNDTISSGSGEDVVYGGQGADQMFGGSGNDTLYGNSGEDYLGPDSGDDLIFGGTGSDTIQIKIAGQTTVDGGELDDKGQNSDVDVLDVTDVSGDSSVSYNASDSEAGTIVFANGDTLAFTNIENVIAEFTVATAAPDGTVHGSNLNDNMGDGYDDTVNNANGDIIGDGDGDDNDIILGAAGDDKIKAGTGDDYIQGDSGDDAINSGSGDDTIFGGIGDDDIDAQQGDDIAYGGAGNDTVDDAFNPGNDTLYGGSGEDSVGGGSGLDILYGGIGDDTLNSHGGADTLYGESGDDSLLSDGGADTLFGGTGNDTVEAGTSNDLVYGGSGNDEVAGEGGNDTLFGGQGSDELNGGTGKDLIYGGADNDALKGASGDDSIYGGASNDEISGDVGEDYINTGSGDDLALGGFGNDTFDIDTQDSDTIVGNEDANNDDIDLLDLSDLNHQYDIQYAGGDDEDGSVFMEDAGGNQTGDVLVFSDIEKIICFTRGTQITTADGDVEIQHLQTGDMVLTMDHGLQPIRWIGKRTVPATGKIAPVVFKAGALGNTRDLRVSPQHRMLVNNWRAELLFGEPEVLSAAKNFVNGDTIFVQEGDTVEYFHILFDTHEIVFAEGIPSESFHPGEEGAQAVDPEQFEELLTLFPELRDDIQSFGPAARMSLKSHEGLLLTSAFEG